MISYNIYNDIPTTIPITKLGGIMLISMIIIIVTIILILACFVQRTSRQDKLSNMPFLACPNRQESRQDKLPLLLHSRRCFGSLLYPILTVALLAHLNHLCHYYAPMIALSAHRSKPPQCHSHCL
jgi:hypothetical protein